MTFFKSESSKFGSSALILGTTLSILAFPLYQLYCQSSGGGNGIYAKRSKIRKAQKPGREVCVSFMTSVDKNLDWEFKPCQTHVTCRVGESALAFFNVKNNTDRVLKGMATYDILPYSAGQYFNKIQCFCFDEQMLAPGETMDMPVLFMIDNEYEKNPMLFGVKNVTLSYTFMESNEFLDIPLPNFMRD